MFAATAGIGFLLAYVSQVGYREATVSIIENQLLTDDFGSIIGDLVCRCRLPEGVAPIEFVCRIEESNKTELLEIPEKTDCLVSYRDRPPFAILPREDPYAMFIYTKLGFQADEVIGQFDAHDHSVVLIRQNLGR